MKPVTKTQRSTHDVSWCHTFHSKNPWIFVFAQENPFYDVYRVIHYSNYRSDLLYFTTLLDIFYPKSRMKITNRGIQLNPKCVFISTGLGFAYWLLPPRSKTVFYSILVGSYAGIAWYDEFFDCSDRLSIDSPLGNLFGWMKPAPDYRTRTYGKGGTSRICLEQQWDRR